VKKKQAVNTKEKTMEQKKWEAMKRWFQVEEVLWLPEDKQRPVILNPGFQQEFFSKTYPAMGHVRLTQQKYSEDRYLPQECIGKIVAVTAIQPKDREGNPKGPLKAKPITKYWELFQSHNGWRTWVNPNEYKNLDSRKNRRKNRGVQRNFRYTPNRLGDDEALQQVLSGLKSRVGQKNVQASGDKSKNRGLQKNVK